MSYVNVHGNQLPFGLRYLSDLMSYRHLCWQLVDSDLRSRFRRTRLGFLWAFIQPLAFALMIAFVWGALQRGLGYWGYAVYFLAGMTIFEFFSTCVMGGQDALIQGGGYLKQARIPFFIFQLRVVLTALVFVLFEIVAVFAFAAATGNLPPPGQHLLLVPVYLAFLLVFATGTVILMSIIGTFFRDVKHISGLALRALMLLSPVMLPREIFDQPQMKFMEFLNPLVPLLDMFRDPILNGRMWQVQDVLVLSAWTVGIWVAAIIASTSVGRRVIFAI